MSGFNEILQAIDTAAQHGMTAVMNQRQGGMLRHRGKPIHQVDLVVSENLRETVVP